MNKSTMYKVLLARRLLELASGHLRSTSDLALSVGVNLLQDAVEAFLLAASEHVNAGIKDNTNYYQYFDMINQKITPELPFRARLIALNKLRVNSKHSGLVPARSEVEGLATTVREFFADVSARVLGKAFSTISLIDLVGDAEPKTFLMEAEAAFGNGDFEGCLVSCRKAVFVRFESRYDIAPFESDEPPQNALFRGFGCRAPYYSRNPEYIKERVGEPTDYIVLDHNDLDMELMKAGLDSVDFWNIWRYTPEVYRRNKDAAWVVKHDLEKLDEDGIAERAEYVLDTAISLFVADTQVSAKTKWVRGANRYYVDLATEGAPIYKKASTASGVEATTPPGLTRLYIGYRVQGLDGGGEFWHVQHFADGIHLWGYLPADLTK
jgi:hypothetical protein